jgi:membrane protease YdiL (CAAX protease family)
MEAGEPLPHAAEPAQSGQPSAQVDLRWLDFWVLFGAGAGALIGLELSIAGLHLGAASRALALLVVSAPYAAATAALAVIAARRADFPILPIVEKMRMRALSARDAFNRIAAGLESGVVTAVGVWIYLPLLTKWLGGAPQQHRFRPHPVDIVCSVLLEEILFRLIVFGALAAALRWLWARIGSGASAAPLWTANVLQSLLFGAAHLAARLGGLGGHPWYVRLPLIPQTWAGLVLGWIYWRYGIESAVVCHATYDLIVFSIVRMAHRSRG